MTTGFYYRNNARGLRKKISPQQWMAGCCCALALFASAVDDGLKLLLACLTAGTLAKPELQGCYCSHELMQTSTCTERQRDRETEKQT